MNRIITSVVIGLIAFAFTFSAGTAAEVIDPKVSCLFGEDWETRKVTIGDHVDQFNETFGEYVVEENKLYHIVDCASVSITIEDTGQVSSIDVFPFNTATNTDSTPESNDTRLFTAEQAETVTINFLPDDAVVEQMCPDMFGVEIMGTSDELYEQVLPETYAATNDETPTQGAFSVQIVMGLMNDLPAEDDPRKVELVTFGLEAWELDC